MGSEHASEASLCKAKNVPTEQVPHKGSKDTALSKAMDVLQRGAGTKEQLMLAEQAWP